MLAAGFSCWWLEFIYLVLNLAPESRWILLKWGGCASGFCKTKAEMDVGGLLPPHCTSLFQGEKRISFLQERNPGTGVGFPSGKRGKPTAGAWFCGIELDFGQRKVKFGDSFFGVEQDSS